MRPNRAKTLTWLAVSAAFVAIGVWMILATELGVIGWICTVFFGLGMLVFGVQLLPNSAYLKVGPEGFTICNLFCSETVRWSAVKKFEARRLRLSYIWIYQPRVVVFDFSPENREAELGRKIAAGISGHEGALPDTYGMSAEELVELLNRYRWRYSGA